MYKYEIVNYQDVSESEFCSTDPEWDEADKVAYAAGLNTGAIPEDFIGWGKKGDYPVSGDEPVIRRRKL